MKPQLALHKYKEEDKKNPKYIGQKYDIYQKYDGWYGYLENGKIYSRQERLIPSLKHLKMPVYDSRLIFEILVRGVPDFHTMNGILNRKTPCKDAYFKVHDMVSKNDSRMFWQRRNDLHELCKREKLWELNLEYAMALGQSDNPVVWQAAAERLWASDKEGVILKRTDGLYSPGKRNFDLMKIKEELKGIDLLVIGLVPGKAGTKYANTLGALICRDKDYKEHRMSGMSDELRDLWWNDKKRRSMTEGLIMGKVVEGNAMKKLPNGSYRELRYKAVRHDKTKRDLD